MEKQHHEAIAYDFVHPGHKLNTQWPVLDLISERIANEMGVALAERLQIPIRGSAQVTTRSKYSQCVLALGKTGTVHEISLLPLSGEAWFCMDISVVSSIVNSYFGGTAELVPIEEARKLSRTELRVLQHITEATVRAITTGWSMISNVNTSIVGGVDVERLANVAQEQIMVTSIMTMSVGDVDLPCQVVYPYEMLSPISSQLQKEKTAPVKQDEQFGKAMQRELLNCELEIRGVLAESHITLGKLLELKPGDFIALRDVQTVSFLTQNMPLFDAHVGNSKGKVSASVSRWHLPVSS